MAENTINTRVGLLINSKGLNPNSFSVRIGQKVQSTHRIIKGNGEPSYEYLHGLLTTFSDIDANWLLLGIGDMQKKSDTIYINQISALKSENKELKLLLDGWKEVAKLKAKK